MRTLKRFTLLLALLVVSTPLPAFYCGEWLVRGRALYLIPLEDTTNQTGDLVGSTVDVHRTFAPELDISYMINDNISLELVLGASSHRITGKGDLEGVKVGSVWVIPPTLMLQYHFREDSCTRPYIGAGINYTFVIAEKTRFANTKFRMNNSMNFAMQGGFDMMIGEDWFFNMDLKYILIHSRASFMGDTSGTAKVDIRPVLLGIGLGRRF